MQTINQTNKQTLRKKDQDNSSSVQEMIFGQMSCIGNKEE